MPIVTISRTFGSGGTPVGLLLAQRMGAEFLDRSIVASVAERAGLTEDEAGGYDEQLPSVWQRVASVLATSGMEMGMPPVPSDQLMPGVAVHERLSRLTQAVIQEAAARGNAVIVGRGAAFVLRGHPGALHVQLHAPLAARVRNLITKVEEIPAHARPDEASLRELCRTFDARRADYIRRVFNADWLNAANYDLAIDTSRFSFDAVADLIELSLSRMAGVTHRAPS
jgi:cytidylate kinase